MIGALMGLIILVQSVAIVVLLLRQNAMSKANRRFTNILLRQQSIYNAYSLYTEPLIRVSTKWW